MQDLDITPKMAMVLKIFLEDPGQPRYGFELMKLTGMASGSLYPMLAKFEAAGVDKSKKIICYCGGGIAATLDLFVLHQLGYRDLSVYDASMSEWATDKSLPIETD